MTVLPEPEKNGIEMQGVFRAIVVASVSIAVTTGASSMAQGGPDIEVSLFSRAIQPGEVVRIEITCTCEWAPERASATAFGKPVALAPIPEAAAWRGLIGIDLDTRPDTYPLTIVVDRPGASPITTKHDLRVLPKEFPTRRLTVDNRFVSPPQEVLDRIVREADRLNAMYGAVTLSGWTGAFRLPVEEPATSNFGSRSVFNGQPRSPHAGVDFGSGLGTPVVAPGAGVVALAEDLYFTGNTVIVDHGLGLYSILAHLSAYVVAAGDRIESGQAVGSVGATGRVTGPHLHWSVRLNAARVDPLSLLAAVDVVSAK